MLNVTVTESTSTKLSNGLRPRWFQELENEFVNELDVSEIDRLQLLFDTLNSRPAEVTQEDVNKLCLDICSIIKGAASKTGLLTKVKIRKKKDKRKTREFIWFDSDCAKERKKLFYCEKQSEET